VGRAIWRLAAPEVATQILRWAFVTADTYFVGQLGGAELAGFSAATFAYWGLQALGLLLSVGVAALVARHTGAQEPHEARRAATQGALWALPYGLVFGLVTWGVGAGLGAVAPSPEAAEAGRSFLVIIAAGLPLMFLGYACDAAFRGSGDPKTPLLLLGGAAALNLALDPVLIFTLGLGIRGAAIATAGSQALAALAGAYLLWRRGLLGLRTRLDPRAFWRVCRVGAPIALSALFFSFIYLALARILAPFGDAPMAGLAIGHRIEALPYLVAVGLAGAATTMVGQNLGAKRPDRASRAAWLCAGYACAIASVAAVIMIARAESLAAGLADDPAVAEAGAMYARVIAFSQLGVALEVVLEGAFGGAGDTLPPMLISGGFTALRIPLGALLATTSMGYAGVYWAISLTGLVRGLCIAGWFARGRWKTRTI
jgi:putative MATE family efflux protein